MEKEALKRIFEFFEDKEGYNLPVKWKLINNIPLTKEDLNVKGDLDLRFSSITSLLEGLKVGGDLYLRGSKITSLPNDLTVDGALFLMGSKITSLPEGLKVGGTLYLYKSALVEYTDKELRNMVKPGFIKGKIFR
jgi:hypothetical protein